MEFYYWFINCFVVGFIGVFFMNFFDVDVFVCDGGIVWVYLSLVVEFVVLVWRDGIFLFGCVIFGICF